MNIKSRILSYLYEKNTSFFIRKIEYLQLKELTEKNLIKVYEDNQTFFENLLVSNFTGFIPKDISEPTLKIFEDHAELLQRWILWQSFTINKRALRDKENLEKYDGMMIYLKVLFLMAQANKKQDNPIRKNINRIPESSFLEKAMQGLNDFKEGYDKKEV